MGYLRLPDCEHPYAIWVSRREDDLWEWDIIDVDGQTEAAGLAADSVAAFAAARRRAKLAAQVTGAP